MSLNPGSNGGQFYRRQIYAQQSTSSSGTGSLPPASELLLPSPALSYPSKVRHSLHSVSSPNVGPPSPYLGNHTNYQALTEPGTPAFLNPSSVPSPSYESIASPASNNHVNQSASSTKPSTPMADCRASPIPNGIYNTGSHYPASQQYYQSSHQQYQRLPSVDTLPSSSNYYSNNSSQMPPPSQPLHHSSNVYVRSMDRSSHSVPPNAYISQSVTSTGDGVTIYPANDEYINGPQEYYLDPYAQQPPSDSPTSYNSHSSPYSQQSASRPYSSQPLQKQSHLRQPLQRQIVYQQQQQAIQNVPAPVTTPLQTQGLQHHVYIQPSTPGQYSHSVNSHHVVSLYDGAIVDRRSSVSYVPPQVPAQSLTSNSASNGTSSQQKLDEVVTNATQPPIMSTTPGNNHPSGSDSAFQPEKPKKPTPKRVRKTAAQLKAEAAAKSEQQQQQAQAQQHKDESLTNAKPDDSHDTSSLLMPPPKVAQAPSVVAAAAKAMHSTAPTNGSQATPPKLESSPQQQQLVQSSMNSQDLTETLSQSQQVTTPKRQRSASQRAQQQKAKLQKQREFELLKAKKEREYMVKCVHLRRTIRALVFKNGALADEVARLKMRIDICREERKMVAKRVQHHERNRIRRQQTQERKALARAVAAQQQQAERKSIDTDDENSHSMDVVLPLNDLQQNSQKPTQTNFNLMTDSGTADLVLSAAEGVHKLKSPNKSRKRSKNKNAESGEHVPTKRRRFSVSATTPAPIEALEIKRSDTELKVQIPADLHPSRSQASVSSVDFSPLLSQKSPNAQSVIVSPLEESSASQASKSTPLADSEKDETKNSPTVKRFSARLNKQPRQATPPTPNEDVISLRTRNASRSQLISTLSPKQTGRITPSTALAATNINVQSSASSSFSNTSSASPSLQLNCSLAAVSHFPLSPLPTHETFARFPANFLEHSENPIDESNDKPDEPRENDFDRPLSELPAPPKLFTDRHLRSNSSTTDSGAEPRQRTNSRASRRPPRHSMTPTSLADSDNALASNSASPIPNQSADGVPSNTSNVMTRRKAAEIAATSTTPPMKTRSKSKLQSS